MTESEENVYYYQMLDTVKDKDGIVKQHLDAFLVSVVENCTAIEVDKQPHSSEKLEALLNFLRDKGYGNRKNRRETGKKVGLGNEGFDLLRPLCYRVGNCVEMTALFLVAASALKLDAKAVAMPQHVFARVRYGDSYSNIETTKLESKPESDEEYALKITSTQKEKGVYLKDLSAKQFYAIILHKIICKELHSGKSLSLSKRQVVRKIIDCFPTMTDIYNSIGINYLLRERPLWSERWLRYGLTFDKENCSLQQNLLQALIARGHNGEAIKSAEENNFLHMSPLGRISVRLLLARAYCRVGQYRKAEGILTFALLDNSRREIVLPYLSCLFYWTGEFKKSAAVAEEYAASGSENEIGVVWMASAYRKLGWTRETIELVKHQTVNDDFLHHIVQLMLGEFDEDTLKRKFKDRSVECECYLGEYWACLDINKALLHWEKCLEISDRNTFENLRALRNYEDNKADYVRK